MSVLRILGLCALAIGVAVAASEPGPVTAQVKQPQIRPPAPPPGGGVGMPPVPMFPPAPPGGVVPPGKGAQPGTDPRAGTPGTAPAQPKKRDQGKWPKDINGKTVDDCVKEMRTNPDPAIRESAVRTLPLYGPIGRDKGAENLVYALTKDPDLNVKMTALGVAPTVLAFFADGPDQPLSDGLTAFMTYLDSDSSHIRYEAVLACAAVGPYMKREKPSIIPKLKLRSKEANSWQLRRAAVAALANIGQGAPPTAEGNKGLDPDQAAVTALLDVLRNDLCAQVRRAAIDALIAVGPVAAAQQNEWRKALDNALKPGAEKEKINALWVRVLILRNDPNGLKGNEAHLNAVADALKSEDPITRIEGCHALGVLGEEAKTKLQGLIDLIRDPKQPPEVVAAAMTAVTSMKSQDQIIMPVLQQVAATHLNPDVRKVASEAMVVLRKK
jgi:HEAT repeat protein